MQKKSVFLFLLILGTAFWGVSFVFVKEGTAEGSPFVFLFYKFAIAALCLALVFWKQLQYCTGRTFLIGVLTGLPLLAGTVLQTVGLKYTSVSNSAFITGLDVLLIPVFKKLIYKKRVQSKIWFASALALTGLYIIAVKNGLDLNIGDVYTIACAIGFALYVLQVGKFSTEKYAMPAVVVTMFFCAAACLLVAVFVSGSVWLPDTNNFWKGVMFAAIPATAYMYGVQNTAQRYLAEEKVGLAYLFEPIFATLAGVLLLGEELTVRTIIGGLLIVGAMFIAETNFKNRYNIKTH